MLLSSNFCAVLSTFHVFESTTGIKFLGYKEAVLALDEETNHNWWNINKLW